MFVVRKEIKSDFLIQENTSKNSDNIKCIRNMLV